MTTASTTTTLTAQPIDPARLDDVRRNAEDGFGNRFVAFAASGEGEPLRCCLRYARAGEQIALVSFAPFEEASVWREVGPVYVHAERCEGYADRGLPDELRRGPRVLRTYQADATMNYDHNTLVGDEDIEPVLDRLLAEPDVAIVHVRTVLPQCFLYAVTR
ncbi:MAG TPA: DUF1203 domain-containing protein [Nocardioides sp.]|uniref:DUF1203 domain-containing protein n=1 Tax=Nocardioides sp. TaxID=35761 RepID=UPI002F41B6AB